MKISPFVGYSANLFIIFRVTTYNVCQSLLQRGG
jgi:hypothetical protein